MKTKNCPFCGKEISDEAIICKFCHRLLIDENGNDILPEGEAAAPAEDTAVTEDKTIVYKKEDLQKLMNKKESDDEAAEEAYAETDDTEVFDEVSDEETEAPESGEPADTSAVIGDENEGGDGFPEDDDFPGDDNGVYVGEDNNDMNSDYGEDDGYGYDSEEYQPRRSSRRPANDRYDDAEFADVADYDPKRTFIITAIVTLGILLVIIVAILVGYKLFKFGGDDDKDTGNQPLANNVSVAADPAADPAAAGKGAAGAGTDATSTAAADPNAAVTEPGNTTFVPSVVNDTISANPEEIVNSSISDPVVDSAATTPEASAPDSTASTDSGMNIVIRPDPNADTSTGTDSTSTSTDSQQPGDGPSSASSSAAEPAGPGAPGFEAAGSYYSWGEAETLMANYAASNNLGSDYSYYGGTDGVEMLYAFYDDYGNATVYRVDLQTGYVSAN